MWPSGRGTHRGRACPGGTRELAAAERRGASIQRADTGSQRKWRQMARLQVAGVRPQEVLQQEFGHRHCWGGRAARRKAGRAARGPACAPRAGVLSGRQCVHSPFSLLEEAHPPPAGTPFVGTDSQAPDLALVLVKVPIALLPRLCPPEPGLPHAPRCPARGARAPHVLAFGKPGACPVSADRAATG